MLSAGLLAPAAGVVSGQDYPSRLIRIVTSGAGGGSDFASRQIAQGITGPLGQPVIVENRPAPQAAEAASRAAGDGYTLLVAGGSLWITPLLQKMPYDIRDFQAISQISREINIVAVHPSVPVKSIKELIALAKARPGELNYSSAAIGSSQRLGAELFKSMAGVNIVGVSYKSSAAVITALISGEVQLTINDAGLLAPHVKSGKLRALAATSAEPSPLAPGLPTVAASGVPGYELVSTTGILAPAKTPGAVITRLNQEIVRVLNRADVKERFLSIGQQVVGGTPEQFAAIIKGDTTKWSKVIKDAGIKVD